LDGGLSLTADGSVLGFIVDQIDPGPGDADAEEIDLSTGQTLTWPITNPIIEGALTSFGW
jgi:hypothetical protein